MCDRINVMEQKKMLKRQWRIRTYDCVCVCVSSVYLVKWSRIVMSNRTFCNDGNVL